MISAHVANQVLHARGAGGYPPGNFYKLQIDAALAADQGNLQKIAMGFPEIAIAVSLSAEELREIIKRESAK